LASAASLGDAVLAVPQSVAAPDSPSASTKLRVAMDTGWSTPPTAHATASSKPQRAAALAARGTAASDSDAANPARPRVGETVTREAARMTPETSIARATARVNMPGRDRRGSSAGAARRAWVVASHHRGGPHAELYERADRLSAALAALGLAKGDCFLAILGNQREAVECELAALQSGLAWVTLNARLTWAEIRGVLVT
jgi:hypothetical protein